jgi:hypothetical protein
MAKSKELARNRQNTPSRADIYIDYAEEENEICEDLMRREESNQQKQNHSEDLHDDFTFEIGDLPSLLKRSDYMGSCSPQENQTGSRSQAQKSEPVIDITMNEADKVIIADDYDDSGRMTVYKLDSSCPTTKVTMSNREGIPQILTPGEGVKPSVNHISDNSDREDTPMLVITEVKSLSSDS